MKQRRSKYDQIRDDISARYRVSEIEFWLEQYSFKWEFWVQMAWIEALSIRRERELTEEREKNEIQPS